MDMKNHSNKLPILVVADDEADVADIIAEVAQDMGFQVHCVHEGDRVVSEVMTIDPVGIVLDLRMPGSDGVEVLRELAQNQCNAMIVLMSGMDERTLHSVQSLGLEKNLQIIDILTKPMRPEQIEAVLAPMLAIAPAAAAVAEPETAQEDCPAGLQIRYTPYKQLTGKDSGGELRLGVNCRWKLDSGEVLGKAQLQKWAEAAGIGRGLLEMTLRQALLQCGPYLLEDSPLQLIISLDASHLHNLDTADFIARTLQQAAVANDKIIIEVSEQGITESRGDAIDVLSRLRIKGFRVAVTTDSIDDSLLALTEKFPLDEVFVDVYPLLSLGNIAGNMEIEFSYSSLASVLRNKGFVTCARNTTQAHLLEFVSNCGFNWAEGAQISDALTFSELRNYLGHQ